MVAEVAGLPLLQQVRKMRGARNGGSLPHRLHQPLAQALAPQRRPVRRQRPPTGRQR